MATPSTPSNAPRPLKRNDALVPDLAAAHDFLRWLDPDASTFRIQTTDSTGEQREELEHYADVDPADERMLAKLAALNGRQANVMVTIDRLQGPRSEAGRALVIDVEADDLDPPARASAHRVVEWAPGLCTAYWRCGDCPDGRQFDVQRALARRLHSFEVHGVRAHPLPGFVHWPRSPASGAPHRVRVVAARPAVGAWPKEGQPVAEIVRELALDVTLDPGTGDAFNASDDDPLVAFLRDHRARSTARSVAEATRIVAPTFYIDGLVEEKIAGTLVAAGSTGKTTLLLDLAVCTALGREWMGRKVKQGAFALVSLDDTEENLNYALARIMHAKKLTEAECALVVRHVVLYPLKGYFGDEVLAFARLSRDGGWEATNLAQRLIAALREAPSLRCVVVDTLRQFAGGSVNDDRVIVLCTKALALVAEALACAGLVAHHTTKALARSSEAPDQYYGGGSGTLGDNLRFVWALTNETRAGAREREQFLQEQFHLTGPSALAAMAAEQILMLHDTRGSLARREAPPTVVLRTGYDLTLLAAPRKTVGERAADVRLKVLQMLPASGNEIVEALGGKRKKQLELVKGMVNDGLMAKPDGRTKYEITSAGVERLAVGTSAEPPSGTT